MKRKLKLFVWEDVLTDYTSGIMFALAESVEEARKIILENGGKGQYSVESELLKEPKVYEDKMGLFLYGGG